MLKYDDYKHLIGMDYTFPDGVKLRVIQIKQREGCFWVTYEKVYEGALPKRYSETLEKFVETYNHLYTNNKGT